MEAQERAIFETMVPLRSGWTWTSLHGMIVLEKCSPASQADLVLGPMGSGTVTPVSLGQCPAVLWRPPSCEGLPMQPWTNFRSVVLAGRASEIGDANGLGPCDSVAEMEYTVPEDEILQVLPAVVVRVIEDRSRVHS